MFLSDDNFGRCVSTHDVLCPPRIISHSSPSNKVHNEQGLFPLCPSSCQRRSRANINPLYLMIRLQILINLIVYYSKTKLRVVCDI